MPRSRGGCWAGGNERPSGTARAVWTMGAPSLPRATMLAFTFRARSLSRHRHVARRADDWMRLRRVPFDRSAR